jgi:hypothetical protein
LVVTWPFKSLFEPLIAARPHVAFERLRTSAVHAGARRLMNNVFDRMGDPDGNFVDDFQGPGFHSRLFELACFAYLEESGWTVERRQRSPDFIVTKGAVKLAIEAVTSNSPLGRDEDIAAFRMPDPGDQDIVAKCNDEFPIRVGSALFSKLQRRYWDQPHCRGIPFVLIVGPFHEPGSTTYVDEGLARYLFGIERYDDWIERDGLLVREAPVTSHSFNGKTIPSNLFASEGAEHLSAIVWSNQFTIPRFFRIVAESEGLPDGVRSARVSGMRSGTDGYAAEDFKYAVGDGTMARESWARGVTVFLNPNSRLLLPDDALACTSTFRIRGGRLVRDVHGFHSLTSFMFMSGDRADQVA